jgi:hypothetical protein
MILTKFDVQEFRYVLMCREHTLRLLGRKFGIATFNIAALLSQQTGEILSTKCLALEWTTEFYFPPNHRSKRLPLNASPAKVVHRDKSAEA